MFRCPVSETEKVMMESDVCNEEIRGTKGCGKGDHEIKVNQKDSFIQYG